MRECQLWCSRVFFSSCATMPCGLAEAICAFSSGFAAGTEPDSSLAPSCLSLTVAAVAPFAVSLVAGPSPFFVAELLSAFACCAGRNLKLQTGEGSGCSSNCSLHVLHINTDQDDKGRRSQSGWWVTYIRGLRTVDVGTVVTQPEWRLQRLRTIIAMSLHFSSSRVLVAIYQISGMQAGSALQCSPSSRSFFRASRLNLIEAYVIFHCAVLRMRNIACVGT